MARPSALEVAVLGLLGEQPLHGYELRTRLDLLIGALRRRISFGSLYPALRALQARGLIAPVPEPTAAEAPARPAPRRRRVVYALTERGEAHLAALLTACGPTTWEDGDFDVRFAFFARTEAATRLAVLEGRRARVHERLERARAHAAAHARADAGAARPGGRRDGYLAELARHSTEQLEREVAWLDQVVERERAADPPQHPTSGSSSGAPATTRPVTADSQRTQRAPRRAP